MANNRDDASRPRDDARPAPPRAGLPHPHYRELCRIDNLRQAYDQVRADAQWAAANRRAIVAAEENGADALLQQLSRALEAKSYRPDWGPVPSSRGEFSPEAGLVASRIVQTAIASHLSALLADEPGRDMQPEAAAARVAGALANGLTRVFATDAEGVGGARRAEVATSELVRMGADADTVHLLIAFLQASEGHDGFHRGPLAPALTTALYAPVDRMMQQLVAAGREGAVARVEWARTGHTIIVLVDCAPRSDWLFAAARHRLRQELSGLGYDPDAVPTQEVDLSQGGKLSLLGYEIVVTFRGGRRQIRYDRRAVMRPRVRGDSTRMVEGAARRRFGAELVRRGAAWLQRRVGGLVALGRAVRKLQTMEASWRLPADLLVGIWNRLNRRRGQVAVELCGLAALAAVLALGWDLYSYQSGETKPATKRPPGFLVGQYNPDPPWGTELKPYGLYVPPHFRGQDGPFPLIVFLHGLGERTMGKIFSAGVPLSIATRFGEPSKNGRFEFVALFPIDPTGVWQTGTPEVDNAMEVLDYVIKRHRIDPDRVYLTGISNGGSGVWRLAEAYPDRWAAVAPLGSFYRPRVPKVRHLPTWIFHGALDEKAPVGPQRELVKELKQATADVRYTEVPDKGHTIFTEVYDSRELYDWFAERRRTQTPRGQE